MIQRAPEKFDKKPNVAWHKDIANYSMLINISFMPDNPEGGETLVKKKTGEIIAMKYLEPGDTTILSGVHIEHCGMPGINFNKWVIAAGLGVADTRRFMRQNNNLYAMSNGDALHYIRQYTSMCIKRIEKQATDLADDCDQKSRENLAENTKKELENFKTSLEVFYNYCKNKSGSLNSGSNKFLSEYKGVVA